MTMRCRHYHFCAITDCPHHPPHEKNLHCTGTTPPMVCGRGENPYCVENTRREQVEDLMELHFPKDFVPEITDRIMEIFEEGEEDTGQEVAAI